MPVALVIFGDESYLDLKVPLKKLPIMFTLSCFNQKARNHKEFWCPRAYIPNLGYGLLTKESRKVVNTMSGSAHNCQYEHSCLKAALASLVQIAKQGGVHLTICGQHVVAKVWIHFMVGDIKGNNTWFGHFNPSKESIEHHYKDCKCDTEDLDYPNPQCVYITRDECHVEKVT
jgi:hypothetical protein